MHLSTSAIVSNHSPKDRSVSHDVHYRRIPTDMYTRLQRTIDVLRMPEHQIQYTSAGDNNGVH
eukprot:m.125867 g.125867  ORF g.125867 m.125867 type:complete len:63 (+) comp17343_c0_seq3:1886-2074(+)